jgi:hypothetical protein
MIRVHQHARRAGGPVEEIVAPGCQNQKHSEWRSTSAAARARSWAKAAAGSSDFASGSDRSIMCRRYGRLPGRSISAASALGARNCAEVSLVALRAATRLVRARTSRMPAGISDLGGPAGPSGKVCGLQSSDFRTAAREALVGYLTIESRWISRHEADAPAPLDGRRLPRSCRTTAPAARSSRAIA